MFKGVSEKKCGLCEKLNHTYDGEIITKTNLFRNLGNSNFQIYQHIKNMKKINEPINEKVDKESVLNSEC
jgi:hypothetical protein